MDNDKYKEYNKRKNQYYDNFLHTFVRLRTEKRYKVMNLDPPQTVKECCDDAPVEWDLYYLRKSEDTPYWVVNGQIGIKVMMNAYCWTPIDYIGQICKFIPICYNKEFVNKYLECEEWSDFRDYLYNNLPFINM